MRHLMMDSVNIYCLKISYGLEWIGGKAIFNCVLTILYFILHLLLYVYGLCSYKSKKQFYKTGVIHPNLTCDCTVLLFFLGSILPFIFHFSFYLMVGENIFLNVLLVILMHANNIYSISSFTGCNCS